MGRVQHWLSANAPLKVHFRRFLDAVIERKVTSIGSIGVQSTSGQFIQYRQNSSSKATSPKLQVTPAQTGSLFNGLQTDFPCLLKNPSAGPEPQYDKIVSGYDTFHYTRPFYMKYSMGVLPELKIAYETWGELNEDRSNAIIIHAGLSASSHAKSHQRNTKPGWWEKFIGPGTTPLLLNVSCYFILYL